MDFSTLGDNAGLFHKFMKYFALNLAIPKMCFHSI